MARAVEAAAAASAAEEKRRKLRELAEKQVPVMMTYVTTMLDVTTVCRVLRDDDS